MKFGLLGAALLAFGLHGAALADRAEKGSGKAEVVGHRLIGQDRGHVVILSIKDGKVEWEIASGHNAHDIQVLKNGNVLYPSSPTTLVELTPDKKPVWTWVSKPVAPYTGAVEIHGFQRLDNGNTMFGETGNKRIIEVNAKGEIVVSVPMTVDMPNSHRDCRMVRKTKAGTYLVCHEGDNTVREYDKTGKVIWSYKLDLDGRPRTDGHEGHGAEVFGAIRLDNGNTLIAGGNNNRVIELNRAGEVVWQIAHNELPGIELHWITAICILPNGHIVFGNTHAGPENPQLIEVTHDAKKTVVWTLKNREVFGNDLCATMLLDVKGKMNR